MWDWELAPSQSPFLMSTCVNEIQINKIQIIKSLFDYRNEFKTIRKNFIKPRIEGSDLPILDCPVN